MQRIAWLTDIHLNFLTSLAVRDFLESVAALEPDALLIGGDIAESTDICHYLARIEEAVRCPVYFVLGNHDYYDGSITQTRQRIGEFCESHPRLHYLSLDREPTKLTAKVGLVGHDGWGDARAGDFLRSLVQMQDYRLIAELTGLRKLERAQMLRSLGDEAAAHIRRVLPLALSRFAEVVLLTHVPPLRAACWHEGNLSNDEWAPHFTCAVVGEAILEIMAAHPGRQLTVLCGHTHGSGATQPLPNVQILTGGADYGRPAVQRVFEFD